MNRYTLEFTLLISGKPFTEDYTEKDHQALGEKLKKIGVSVLAETAVEAHVKAATLYRDIMKQDVRDNDRVNRDHLCFEIRRVEEV